MSNITQNIKSYKIVYPQIYSYILPELKLNEGSQKIGYTEQENVHVRILQQVKTAAFKLNYELLWSAPAFFKDGKESFMDKLFHKFLEKKGIERRWELGQEWFYFNGEPLKSKDLFDLFRKEKFSALQNGNGKIEYTLRFEQEEAVKKALEYFEKTEKGEFLWNAKPRFGKTLSSYDLAKRLKANKVLIVTNRPAIANSWLDDYEMFVDAYAFISETSSLKNRASLTREQHIATKPIKPLITFLSLQDLKGSKFFGGNYDKLRWVADLEWDLLIIDEAHEGVDTGRTDAAFDVIKRKNTLHLSGTPFKALANEKFPKEAIYNWTYLDEQKIKQIEIEEGEIGEHTDLPDLKLFTYRISQMITDHVNEGIEIDEETRDYAFDLNEFFRAKDKKFVHENEVTEFLKNLTSNKKYPFSTTELREELKHTFWYVGNRVDSVKALEQLLKKDPIFKDYKIIVAAGDGRSFEEEENDFNANESSFEKVKKAIAENDKTITLTCGQLTTGVTIKEWTAVLMLTDIKTPSLYMQAAFRAQNPYKEWRNGELVLKKSAYLFDFAPTRVLEIYDQFANGLNPKTVKGEITEKDREENIKELLNFFPVISEDVNGEMIELDANKVLTFPNALAATEIVNARFMTNLLFNDSLKGVFNFPKEVEEILDKMQVEKNKRVQKTKNTLDLDDARTVNNNKTKEINNNTEIILGEKIFKTNTERVVDNLLEQNNEQIYADELIKKVSEVAEPLIAKYKEVYKATQAETNEVTKQIQEKVNQIAEEYNNAEIKDSEALKQKLIDTIELDFVTNKVTKKEEEKVEKVQKTKEEEIRDRLRSFTRTIPMFIMANDSREEITIDNFDTEIDDQDFLELTSITKGEFHKLRDGFDYEEDGERKIFQGVFNKYRFNASIAEFRLKKDQLANYFTAEEDIFELIPNQKTNQIFTPKKVVQMMINQLEEHDPSLFTRTDSTFVDLYMKSGMYITEIVKKLYHNTREQYKSDEDCLKHILENQVYGLAPTPILQGITQSYIFGFDVENKISRKNFVQHDITPQAQQEIAKQKLLELLNLKKNMKFDAVVGNPPYQESVDKTETQSQANSKWVYYLFQNIADIIGKRSSLIYPFGGWFDNTRTYQGFGERILSDGHTISINAFEGTSDRRAWYRNDIDPKPIFGEDVNLSAGISIVNRNQTKIYKTFEYSNRMYSDTARAVNTNEWKSLSPNPDFTVGIKLSGDRLEKYVSNKTFGIESDFIEKNPKLFSTTPNSLKEPVRLLTNDKSGSAGRAKWYYIERTTIEKNNDLIEEYKVAMPSAYPKKTLVSGVPTIENVLTRASELVQIYKPKEIFGRSKMLIFNSPEKVDVDNFMKYTQTRFFAYMVLNEPNRSFSFGFVIPLLDFTTNSDVDWSKSISEIDQQLYKKYNLSKEEIAFIEEKVQPMN
jgi:superfamily II DNA or RNA helicase